MVVVAGWIGNRDRADHFLDRDRYNGLFTNKRSTFTSASADFSSRLLNIVS